MVVIFVTIDEFHEVELLPNLRCLLLLLMIVYSFKYGKVFLLFRVSLKQLVRVFIFLAFLLIQVQVRYLYGDDVLFIVI